MSEEFIVVPHRFSSFWPLLIFFTGYLTWGIFQAYQLDNSRVALLTQESISQTYLKNSQDAQAKLISLGQDLVQLSATDPAAAQVVNDFQIRSTPPTGKPTPVPTPPH